MVASTLKPVRVIENPTNFQFWSGAFAASIMTGGYIVSFGEFLLRETLLRHNSSKFQRLLFFTPYFAVYTLAIAYFVLFHFSSAWTWAIVAPVFISAILPPLPSATLIQSWPFKYMPAYFDYAEVRF
jgi:hypothetical protein